MRIIIWAFLATGPVGSSQLGLSSSSFCGCARGAAPAIFRHLPPLSNVGSRAATRDGLLSIAPSPPRAAPTRKAPQEDWRTQRPQRLATYPVRTTFRHLPPSRATPHRATPSHASTRAASTNFSPRRCPHLAAGVEPHALRLHVPFATSPGEPPSTTFRHLEPSCMRCPALRWPLARGPRAPVPWRRQGVEVDYPTL